MTKVLVVDDSEIFREIYSQVLINNGFEVETAANGKEAIDKMLSSPPQLILLDYVMPVMNGQQVLAEMKKHELLNNIPVIMLTIVSAEIKGQELLSAGSLAAYLTKDKVTTENIVQRVKEVLGTYQKPLDTTTA